MVVARERATVKSELQAARSRLTAARVSAPGLDAEVLLAHVLGVRRERLRAHPERVLSTVRRRRYRRAIGRRAAYVPVAYLTGWREFYGHRVRVTPQVLIPRPETERLVEAALAFLHAHPRATRVVDLGTGSGAIAVALAKGCPRILVDAIEVSAAALPVARANFRLHRLYGRVRLRRGDLLRGAKPADLLAANLPYLSAARRRALPKEVRWEPRSAVDGGPDGLRLIRRALRQALAVVRPGGCLLVECDPAQARTLRALAHRLWPHASVSILRDLAGRSRVLEVALP